MCHHPSRFAEDCVDFNMHEEIEEPKKVIEIIEKKLPAELKKAAYKKVREMFGNDMVDWDGHSLVDASKAADLFIAGAEWQYQKDRGEFAKLKAKEWSDGYNEGIAKGKEKMMEKAVEADVNTYGDLVAGKSWAEFVVEMPTNNLGDKVRIIVIKEDEK